MAKKALLLVLVMVLIAGTYAGCTSSTSSTKVSKPSGPKIAVLLPSLAGSVYVALAYGILDEAEKLGLERPAVLAAGGYDKIDVQVKQIEDSVASGVQGIIIMPLSYEALIPAIDKAIDKGVKVLEMGNETGSKKVPARMRTDQEDIGVRLARWIGKALNGKGEIVMFNGPAGASWSQLETGAFKRTLAAEFPDVRILAERWAPYDAGTAMNIMNDYLQTFPKIDYVYAAWEAYAEGAARAIEAAGKKGQIRMASVGLSDATMSLLQEGLLDMIVAPNNISQGRVCLQTVLKLIKGESVPPMQFVPIGEITREQLVSDPNSVAAYLVPKGWTVPK